MLHIYVGVSFRREEVVNIQQPAASRTNSQSVMRVHTISTHCGGNLLVKESLIFQNVTRGTYPIYFVQSRDEIDSQVPAELVIRLDPFRAERLFGLQ